jgi:hypothetical protein
MSKTIQQTLEFIDIVDFYLQQSYNTVFDNTRKILDESSLDKHDRSHLEWGLTHMHTSLGEFHRDLARHKQTLINYMSKEQNASGTIQDDLRKEHFPAEVQSGRK